MDLLDTFHVSLLIKCELNKHEIWKISIGMMDEYHGAILTNRLYFVTKPNDLFLILPFLLRSTMNRMMYL